MSTITQANSTPGPNYPLETENLAELKSTVLGFWPERKTNFFPGPSPVSIEKDNLYKLENYPYVISIKSDGTRYMLMFYKIKNNYKVYLIDRTFNFYKVEDREISLGTGFKELYGSLPCGALFDGEMVSGKTKIGGNGNIYVIHDCICINSTDISKNTFTERLENIKEHQNILRNFSLLPGTFKITLKTFYKFNEVDKLLEDLPKLDHKTDGLIFTPALLPIGNQTQYTLFKWKDKKNHTFDFRITETTDSYNAYVGQGKGEEELFASVLKNTIDGHTFGSLLKKLLFKNKDIVECSFNQTTNSFDPVLIRSDKSHPNMLFTVKKTLLNIDENITFEEIIEKVREINAKSL